MQNLDLIAAIIVLGGSVFLFLGALGLLRMPDCYNRIQAGTKATTLGSLLTFIGLALYNPEWWPKMLILTVFILATNPISSHVLARAAYFIKIPLARPVVDKLKEKRGE